MSTNWLCGDNLAGYDNTEQQWRLSQRNGEPWWHGVSVTNNMT